MGAYSRLGPRDPMLEKERSQQLRQGLDCAPLLLSRNWHEHRFGERDRPGSGALAGRALLVAAHPDREADTGGSRVIDAQRRHGPQYYTDDCLWTRKRRMVTAPDRVLLTGSRSILPRPGDEKWMPSPSSTGNTYTRISSTSPRRRHWAATSAPRISRFLPPAALRAVATASPMSPVRNVTFGSGGSGGLWVRTNVGPEKG